MSLFLKTFTFFVASVLMLSVGYAESQRNVVKCTVYGSMWVSKDSKMSVIEEIVIESEETETVANLQDDRKLTIQRYYDNLMISITRPPTEQEIAKWESLRLGYPLTKISEASGVGALHSGKPAETVEMGSRDFYVVCKYQ